MSPSKRFPALDIVKFIMALLLVCAHYASEFGQFPGLIDKAFSIYIIAVPFFLSCSAFLFFYKERSSIKGYIIKIAKMYGAWSAVYFVFVVLDWIINKASADTILEWLHQALVFSTYYTIWFLPALAVGMLMTFFLTKKLKPGVVIAIAALFYIFGAFGRSYSFALEGTPLQSFYDGYNMIFHTTRNGVFNAFPFCVVGWMAASGHSKKSFDTRKNGILSAVFLAAVIGESLLLKLKFHNTDENTVFMLIPFTYFFIRFCVSVKVGNFLINPWLRRMSTYIFTSQRIWLSALPAICPPFAAFLSENSWFGLAAVIVLTFTTSAALIEAGRKIKIFNVLG